MVLTLEEKFAAVCIALFLCVVASVVLIDHFIEVGKAQEKAAVFEQEQKDIKAAQLTEKDWREQLDTARTARQKEIDDAKAAALKPVEPSSVPAKAVGALPARIVYLRTVSPAMPASTSPAASTGSAASGPVCSGLVPGSPAEMRSFDEAKSADQLIADYRDLYDSWPKN